MRGGVSRNILLLFASLRAGGGGRKAEMDAKNRAELCKFHQPGNEEKSLIRLRMFHDVVVHILSLYVVYIKKRSKAMKGAQFTGRMRIA